MENNEYTFQCTWIFTENKFDGSRVSPAQSRLQCRVVNYQPVISTKYTTYYQLIANRLTINNFDLP